QYDFEGNDARVRFHLGYSRNWDSITESWAKVVNDSTIVGLRRSTGWARDQHVYFQTVFSSPFTYQLSDGGKVVETDSLNGRNILVELSFGEKKILVKTGISSVSTGNAALNLAAEQNGFDFPHIRRKAAETWEKKLRKVKITADEKSRKQFYTAMYQSMLAPTIYSDVNGQYRGADGLIHTSGNYPRYTTYSLWDTYRALHPWLTITQPDSVAGLVNSMLDFEQESGLLPVWNLWGGETNMMIGYHAIPVIADALKKGIAGIDTNRAYQAMRNSGMQADSVLGLYRKRGFIPYEATGWSVSKTMEYAYDDWCIAQVAAMLDKADDQQYFAKRSTNYRYHFDQETRFFRARSADGRFKIPFDPLAYHPEDYCEANAWQYLWYVPHNVTDLIELLGGAKAFEQRLDALFDTRQTTTESPDWISGYIGQYVHGNEPSHHVPYLYQFVGAPHKTQQRVRQVMDELYAITPDGLSGNEDCGQLSAWYLFSALGFYPVNPASGAYVLGSPVVASAAVDVGGGKVFSIKAVDQSAENIYVKAVKLNGQTLEAPTITHDQIMNGGELVFYMTNRSADK
ncbi:MAG: GH92 family glycosyl hydrolase, partial [Bacteroidota bacterium]